MSPSLCNSVSFLGSGLSRLGNGNAYSFLGKMDVVGAAYARAITEGRRLGNRFIAFSATVNLGELRRLHGRWRKAEGLYREVLAWAEMRRARPLSGLVHVGLGSLGTVGSAAATPGS